MSSPQEDYTSSFSAKRINTSTFLVEEDDLYKEHPFIYVKVHPTAPVIILSDTGCDEPSLEKKHSTFTHLRDYLEHCPVQCNNNKPLNPHGERQYIIICTHCHYDHIGGISQFLEGGTTEIVASSAGRDFIESDLDRHGLFNYIGKYAPYYQVTHWAQSFERLSWPLPSSERAANTSKKPVDLGITLIPTPGHTPDSLAWYDHEEMHLYVGDTLYEEGPYKMRIIWPGDGNFVEWAFQTTKLQYLVKGENAKSRTAQETAEDDVEGWIHVPRRVKIGCGHATSSADAEELFAIVGVFGQSVLRGEIPIVEKFLWHDEAFYVWREKDGISGVSFMMPARLMAEAQSFFQGTIISSETRDDKLSLFRV